MTTSFPNANDPERWHLLKIERTPAVQGLVAGADEPVIVGTGWVNDPQAVKQVTDVWAARGQPVRLQDAAPRLMRATGNDDNAVFFWDAETQVLGKRLATWNQKQVGSCVGFGSTRESQDLLLWEIASGDPYQWPGFELAPEVTYGGSRVEIGGGNMRGDGSVGAWAAEFLMKYGVVIRGVYGNLDLTSYSESTCRQLGANGLPSSLETIARVHPVKAAAMVKSADELWAALGGGKPVMVCSDRGFSMRMDSDGFCSPSGVWQHCMGIRARFVHPRKGRCVAIGNSWADYMQVGERPVDYVSVDGSTKQFSLPAGAFCTTLDVAEGMVSQGDSFALAGLQGWERTTPVDYTP